MEVSAAGSIVESEKVSANQRERGEEYVKFCWLNNIQMMKMNEWVQSLTHSLIRPATCRHMNKCMSPNEKQSQWEKVR